VIANPNGEREPTHHARESHIAENKMHSRAGGYNRNGFVCAAGFDDQVANASQMISDRNAGQRFVLDHQDR